MYIKKKICVDKDISKVIHVHSPSLQVQVVSSPHMHFEVHAKFEVRHRLELGLDRVRKLPFIRRVEGKSKEVKGTIV